ncbi:uncharacterized protein EI90DRAFT_2997683 [Cantharellus anzutake]|uniref:uncharacterized protein n=1 Tax=Cantharellus anzutake TaxID=1750568 RepID=UPI00190430A2|nr:uncharacterized protein EI90DRAFT_2997683 [Cantharellus anzutake]KAF8328907.1 hypothetical protein EI90DRAFT_2997683 [Cantharellus anzutake]
MLRGCATPGCRILAKMKRTRGPGKQTKIQEYIAPSQVDKPTPTEGQEARLRRRKPLPRENHFTDDSDSSEYVSKIKLEEGKTNRKHKSPVKSRVKARARVLSSGEDSPLAGDESDDVRRSDASELSNSTTSSSSSSPSSSSSKPQRPFKRRRLIPDSFRPASKVKESENGETRIFSSTSSDPSSPEPVKRRRVPEPQSSPQQPSSGDDEDDIMDEVDSDRIIEQRFRTRALKQSAFSRNLEMLKERQAKRRGTIPSCRVRKEEEERSESPSSGFSDSLKPFRGAVPPGETVQSDREPESDEPESDGDSFVVEDDGDVEGKVVIPIEFSMARHQDLRLHFKNLCLYFVHLAATEQSKRQRFVKKARKDREFQLALSVLDRKLSGFRDSLVVSSKWTSKFRQELDTYPLCSNERLTDSLPICDACHISGRIATISTTLSGKPYDRETFEVLEVSNRKKHEDVMFSMGRFCARRASVYHSFSHWQHELFSIIESEVNDLQRPGDSRKGKFAKTPSRASKQMPEDVEDPVQIMEWLDRRGIVDYEYSRMKKLMESARNLDTHEDDDTFLG